MRAPYPIMLMTEDQIRSVSSIFSLCQRGFAVVDLFGDLRCVGVVWNIPLTYSQVQDIVIR